MIVRHHVIATAGHIDHGKSALVRALTGTDPDRLPEEKARGITIDLGFAEFTLTAPDGSKIHAGIVDVPGHEDFVSNMIAGVGSIDLALFTVAADDGWMPQTEEHLQILNYLGVNRAVVAITKSDLGKVDDVTQQIRSELAGTTFEFAPVIPVSAHNQTGLDHLGQALAAGLFSCTPPRDFGKPRLFVDRAFSLQGVGTVATGTLTGGLIKKNEQLTIGPGNLRARVRSLHNHGSPIDHASPGMRTALNLPERSPQDVARGAVLTKQEFSCTRTLDVFLERSSRVSAKDRASRALKNGHSIYLHHGTTRAAAKIHLRDRAEIRPGEKVIAQLRLDTPVLAFRGDRFVIRDAAERDTLAGGIVLDPRARPKRFRSAAQGELLQLRSDAPGDVRVAIKTELARYGPTNPGALLRRSAFSDAEIAAAVEELRRGGEVAVAGAVVADAQQWRLLVEQSAKLIDQAHREKPEKPGMELDRLRATLNQPEMILEALIAALTSGEFIRQSTFIARRSHKTTLSRDAEDSADKILKALATKPFDPPAAKQVAPDPKTRETLKFLIQEKRVIEIAPDVVLLQTSFEQMKTVVRQTIAETGPATVSALRQRLDSSRRVVVPLLEKLDREGLTRREGDRRVLAKN